MKTLHHPTLNTTQTVPDTAVDAWVEAGWRTSKPTPAKPRRRKSKPKIPAAATAADTASDNPEGHET